MWEYTRFLAERNSVIRYERPEHLTKLPVPSSVEYAVEADEEEDQNADNQGTQTSESALAAEAGAQKVNDFNSALRSIANEEYEPAITFFKEVVAQKPHYHTGWLRLGYSQRELAMRKRFDEPLEAEDLLNESIASLSQAAKHLDPSRQAQALYERSKAYFHRARSSASARQEDLKRALEDAETAYAKERESRYETWIEYLNQHRSD